MEAPHTEGMRPIHSSHLAAIILSAENHESRMLKKDTVKKKKKSDWKPEFYFNMHYADISW